MTNRTVHLDRNQVPSLLLGSYNGKHLKAVITDSVIIPADAGLWSGGSRDTYQAIGLDGQSFALSDDMSAPWDNRKDQVVTLRPGLIVRRYSNGIYRDLTFYIHPADAVKLLPAPSQELSANEKLVLKATKSFKSSYNGKDRYEMMRDESRHQPTGFPTRDEWNTVKASLITKGLLNKAGAITTAGRNAIEK